VGYEFVDHTSEITLRVEGPTFEVLVVEATRGVADLVPDSIKGRVEREARDFHIQAKDEVTALVGWLNEIVYLSEAELWLPVDVERAERGGAELLVRAKGTPLDKPWVLVKAATLHRASIREVEEGLVAEVTLDI
jgi:SHS2 domain-containing protein